MAEEKQRRQVEDSLMKLNVVEAPSIRSRVLDEDSSTTENMNESKHVYDDKGSCELTYSSCFLKATFQTKFVELGHPPVGCCSLTVPNLFGHSQCLRETDVDGQQ
ncbi:uncharacterized protein LOC124444663 isoform X5 [Xenia sp. Carnegie-2017]|nr:uncharacterized protein LOC124444663 isoform X5 [Xenia sp. Carnegie-2017]